VLEAAPGAAHLVLASRPPAAVQPSPRLRLLPNVAICLLGKRHVAASTCPPDNDTSCVAQVTAAAGRVLSEVVAVARRDGLVAQSYWLATTLALGAFLKARA
jgi:hypothetical protein